MKAIIEVAGKQYTVEAGQTIVVDRLSNAVNDAVEFPVMLTVDGDAVTTGAPYVKGVVAKAKVLEQFRDKKVVVFKYKPKKNERKKQGHRQPYTKILIESIG